MEPKVKSLTSRQFATTFALSPQQFAWFLGAGASASAGIPTAHMMIRDFKTRLFCQEVGIPRREVDSTDPLWVDRVDEHFRRRASLPEPGDPAEYSASFEALYPSAAERRRYIEDAVRLGTPSYGHRVLAALISTKRAPCVFTTNFDPLVESASNQTNLLLPVKDRAMLVVAALDSAERAERCIRESAWPFVAKLHGDYQSISIKNTEAELRTQDERLRGTLTAACERFGLVVIGYSGRDASVMEALTEAFGRAGGFSSGIYWVTRSGRGLLPAVASFLDAATAAGVNAFIVESQNFDEFAADLAGEISFPETLEKHIREVAPTRIVRAVTLPRNEALRFPVLRCSALPLAKLPAEARRLSLLRPATTVQVRDFLKEARARGIVASTGREVAAFGVDDELISALGPLGARLNGTIRLQPEADSWALGLIYDALARALSRRRPLFPRMWRTGHFLLIAKGKPEDNADRLLERERHLSGLRKAYASPLYGTIPVLGFEYSEGVRIRLEQCANTWWCVFDPVTFVDVPREDRASEEGEIGGGLGAMPRRSDPANDWRRERWARRYNESWSNIVDAWAALLGASDDGAIRACGLDAPVGVDAIFSISTATAWSRPAHTHDYFTRTR